MKRISPTDGFLTLPQINKSKTNIVGYPEELCEKRNLQQARNKNAISAKGIQKKKDTLLPKLENAEGLQLSYKEIDV